MSAPLMFVSAKMTTLTKLDPRDYVNDLDSFLFNMSILGLVASVSIFGYSGDLYCIRAGLDINNSGFLCG